MYSSATKMSYLTIINTGLTILFVDFRRGTLFESEWYKKSGSSICLTLIITVFINNFINAAFSFYYLFFRWYDRGFKCAEDSDKHSR